MGRISKEKQWLNVIIIAISAMILMFTLLGKFMGSGLEPVSDGSPNNPVKKFVAPSLRLIDFGSIKLHHKNGVWMTREYATIAKQWQSLLNEPAGTSVIFPSSEKNNTYFVQLYFVDNIQPLIAKVERVEWIETESVGDINSQNNQRDITIITFVSNNLQLTKPAGFIHKIIPDLLIEPIS